MKHLIKFNENSTNCSLYYFNPNDYGEQYMVLAYTPEQALEYLLKFISKNYTDEDSNGYYDQWLSATVNNLPPKYTIDIYNVGDVLESEIC